MPKDYTLNESKLASYANSAVECGAMSEPIHSLICDVIEDGREYRRQIKRLKQLQASPNILGGTR